MKRKIWTQLSLEPWEYQFNSIAVETGITAHEAKNKVVMEWMQAGDFRPLLWMIWKEGMLRQPIVGLLAQMLASGQLTFRKGRGRRSNPEAAAKDPNMVLGPWNQNLNSRVLKNTVEWQPR